MKQVLITGALALACVAAFAQTPATPPTPGKPPESGAVPIAPKTAAAAEMKVDARKAANPGADGTMVKKTPETGAVVTTGKAADKAEMNLDKRKAEGNEMMAAMDTNGDGMISRKEYDAYHGNLWKKMRLKNGLAAQADVQMMLKQGAGGM